MPYYEHRSRKATWSWRLAALSLALFMAALATHRFFQVYLPTPTAVKIFAAAAALAIAAIALALISFPGIWNRGYLGAGHAGLALVAGAIVLAFPLSALPSLLTLPSIHDISTDTVTPPAYDRIVRLRQGQANPPQYQRSSAPLQAAAYGDIQSLIVMKPVAEVFSSARESVKALGWRIWEEQAPESTKAGRIEAEDRTLIFGFSDDVVVRVTGTQKEAKVDVRSSSRFGAHDLGRNASRVRRFLGEIRARLAQADRSDQMARMVALRDEENDRKAVAAALDRARLAKLQAAASPPSQPSIQTGQPQTPARQGAGQASAASQDPSQFGFRSEQKGLRKRRQREMTLFQRRFWEGR